MVATAYEDGSDDNISVAIAEFGEVQRERAAGTIPIEFEPPPAASTGDADADRGGEGIAASSGVPNTPVDKRAIPMSKGSLRVATILVGTTVASALLYFLLVL